MAPAAELVRGAGVWIAEGLPDFLTLAAYWSEAQELAPAVLGVLSGSWTAELADRVPDGCKVVVATDPDPAGEKYAARIRATLAERVRSGGVAAAGTLAGRCAGGRHVPDVNAHRQAGGGFSIGGHRADGGAAEVRGVARVRSPSFPFPPSWPPQARVLRAGVMRNYATLCAQAPAIDAPVKLPDSRVSGRCDR